MSVEETKKVVDEYLQALTSGGDFASFFTDGVRWTTMETGQEVVGRDAVRDLILLLHTQAFDARPELVGIVVGDGTAALEAVFVATHTGTFGELEATGREVRLPYSVFYDIEGGRISTLRAYFPMAALLGQLHERASATA